MKSASGFLANILKGLDASQKIVDFSDKLTEEFMVSVENSIDYFAEETCKFFNAELCSIFMINGDKINLTTEYSKSYGAVNHPNTEFQLSNMGLTKYITEMKEPLVLCGDELRFHDSVLDKGCMHQEWLPSEICHSLLSSPIRDYNNEPIGLIKVYNKIDIVEKKPNDNMAFDFYDCNVLYLLSNKLSDLISISKRLFRHSSGYPQHVVYTVL